MKYITVKEYAAKENISKQAAYKRLGTSKYKCYTVIINNKLMVKESIFQPVENMVENMVDSKPNIQPKLTDNIQPVEMLEESCSNGYTENKSTKSQPVENSRLNVDILVDRIEHLEKQVEALQIANENKDQYIFKQGEQLAILMAREQELMSNLQQLLKETKRDQIAAPETKTKEEIKIEEAKANQKPKAKIKIKQIIEFIRNI